MYRLPGLHLSDSKFMIDYYKYMDELIHFKFAQISRYYRQFFLIRTCFSFPSSCLLEPCPPRNVQTNVQCQHNMGTVIWEASFGAVEYVVTLAGRNGHFLSCYTNDTFCNVEGLNCGVTYYTNVIAIGEVFNSSSSTTVLLVSGNIHRFINFLGLYLSPTINKLFIVYLNIFGANK